MEIVDKKILNLYFLKNITKFVLMGKMGKFLVILVKNHFYNLLH